MMLTTSAQPPVTKDHHDLFGYRSLTVTHMGKRERSELGYLSRFLAA